MLLSITATKHPLAIIMDHLQTTGTKQSRKEECAYHETMNTITNLDWQSSGMHCILKDDTASLFSFSVFKT